MYFDKCDHHSGVYTLRFATKRLLPTRLILMDGYWYCTAFDLTKKHGGPTVAILWHRSWWKHPIKPCMQKRSCWIRTRSKCKPIETFPSRLRSVKQERIFLKHPFSNMSLCQRETGTWIEGKFDQTELRFMTNYFLGFGEHVEIISPEILRKDYLDCIKRSWLVMSEKRF